MALTLPSSSTTSSTSNALAVDIRSLNSLKYDAGTANNAQTTREVAKQFESLFMRELIKSMRDATMKSGLMEGEQANLGQDMLDQQLSVSMSGQQGGLSEAIARQLSRQMGGADANFSVPPPLSLPQALPRTASSATGTPAEATGPAPKGRDGFVQHLSGTAERVAQESGIPASFMLGQAGHETGWGKSEIKHKDGSNSFNLFGIKAGKGWTGKVAEITTTEYINGKAQKVTAKFRAYDSYEDSFRDYAKLIKDSPRYEKAESVAQSGSAMAYASALQKAGYATDPEYAKKLGGAINSVLRTLRAQAWPCKHPLSRFAPSPSLASREWDAPTAGSVQSSDIVRAERLRQLQEVFSGGTAGLGAAINDMMNAFSDVVSAPTDITARTVVLTRMDEPASRMRAAADRINEIQYTVTEQLQSSITAVNSLAGQMASVNEQIARAKGNGQTPNDLLDQRDQITRDINQYVQTPQIPADDGTVGLFVAGSQPLVLGTTATSLSIDDATAFPGSGQIKLFFNRPGAPAVGMDG